MQQLNPEAVTFVPGASLHVDSGPALAPAPAGPALVATQEAMRDMLTVLQQARMLCIDCEGSDLSKGSWRNGQLKHDEGPLHGRICLMQIGQEAGRVYAIDILELGSVAFDTGLKQLLENPYTLKVVHDFRQDADALWHQYGVTVTNLFDCQVADILIRRLQGHKTTYVSGSAKLLTNYGLESEAVSGLGEITQEKKREIHEQFSKDRHLWERRPLPADMVAYAKADVLPLPKLYGVLRTKLVSLLQGNAPVADQCISCASYIYALEFACLDECRCRLCCDASQSARFDGNRMLSQLSYQVNPGLIRQLWREEDNKPLSKPGPSKFYVNDQDESVPIAG